MDYLTFPVNSISPPLHQPAYHLHHGQSSMKFYRQNYNEDDNRLNMQKSLTLSARGMLRHVTDDVPFFLLSSVNCFSSSSILANKACSFFCCSRRCFTAFMTGVLQYKHTLFQISETCCSPSFCRVSCLRA